jgi:hypothetical protein
MTLMILDDVVVSFPADYPNSVKHFLMLGFVGMLIGSAIFFYFGFVCYFITLSKEVKANLCSKGQVLSRGCIIVIPFFSEFRARPTRCST